MKTFTLSPVRPPYPRPALPISSLDQELRRHRDPRSSEGHWPRNAADLIPCAFARDPICGDKVGGFSKNAKPARTTLAVASGQLVSSPQGLAYVSGNKRLEVERSGSAEREASLRFPLPTPVNLPETLEEGTRVNHLDSRLNEIWKFCPAKQNE